MSVAEWVLALGGEVGVPALIGLAVILILRGDIVPRRVLDDRLGDMQDRLADVTADRDRWRTATDQAIQAFDRLAVGVASVADAQTAVTRVVESLPTARGAE